MTDSVSSLRCSSCAADLAPGARFCTQCGAVALIGPAHSPKATGLHNALLALIAICSAVLVWQGL